MKITVTINSPVIPPPPTEYRLPGGYTFWRLKWDDEIPGQTLRKNLPATVESLEGLFIPMPQDYQMWFWKLWNRFAPANMAEDVRKKRWATFWHSTLAWTNHGHGSDVLADYVNMTNLDKSPMARQMLTAEGNIVMQVGEKSYLGEKWIICKALKVTDLIDIDDLIASPWLLHYCTTYQVVMPNDHHGVGRFPQLDGNDVPLPLLSRDGTITFREKYLEKLPAGSSLPNPYNPPYHYSPSAYPRA